MNISVAEYNVVVGGLRAQNDLLQRQNVEWRDQNRQLRSEIASANAAALGWQNKLGEVADRLTDLILKHQHQRDACGKVARGEIEIGSITPECPDFSSALTDVERLRVAYVDLLNKAKSRKR